MHCALVDDHPSWLEELQQGLLEDEPPWPSIGDDWLGYQIDEQIGQGGLARVYLASELSAGQRRVVLKITPFETGEGHLQSNLSHDSIVPVFTVRRDEVSGLTAIVMPYWGRATLQEVRDRVAAAPSRDSVPPEMIHQIARQHSGARSPTVPGRRTSAGRPTSFRQALARLGAQLCAPSAAM